MQKHMLGKRPQELCCRSCGNPPGKGRKVLRRAARRREKQTLVREFIG